MTQESVEKLQSNLKETLIKNDQILLINKT